ncbi:MAG: phytanoyl-CoA dioxygenase [Dehalococcoidia bacterium]|nr:phytanoyl-CoA dioxygenase [Dehalococcoidia bacterium]
MSASASTQKQRFARDGYAIYREVLDEGLVQEARDHVVWLLKKNPGLRPEQLNYQLMRDDAFWVRLVSDDRLLDIAQEYVGPNIALFASHYISKPPQDGQPVLWHQDGSYWPLEPMEVVTLWLAVEGSTQENGCLRVIPGTQAMQLHEMERRTDVPNVLSSQIDQRLVQEDRAIDLTLAAGDVSVHHPNIIHGSNANTSGAARTGLTIRYIPTTTRIVSEHVWPAAFLLRGNAVEGVNDYLARPRYTAGKHMPFRGCERWG